MAKKTRVRLPALRRVKKKKNEVTRLGAALRGLGGLGGGAVGSLFGLQGQGSSLGRDLGGSLSRWLGSGDYDIKANSIVSSLKSSGSIPSMHNTGQSVIVRHKEFIGDVIAGTGSAPTPFEISNTFSINPGLATSFPWLSTLAQNFQEYTFKGLVYHYVPTSGNSVASTNTALGSVMMATNYRATLPTYTSKVYMLNEYFSSDARPSETFVHPIECDPKENPYNVQYVRTSAVPSGEDPKTYDLGVMSVATQGMPASSTNVGELWATYEVELRKPVALGILANDSPYALIERSSITTSTANLGTTTTLSAGDAISAIGVDSITFRKGLQGDFWLSIAFSEISSVTAYAKPIFTSNNCTVTRNLSSAASTLTAASGELNQVFLINIPDAAVQASITAFTNNTFTGTVPAVYVYLTQINIDIP
jgi:hypothetical protein